MAKTDFKSVDDYLASQPKDVQAVLKKVRSALRRALPDAEEIISYQIPAYRVSGRVAIYFAGWKQHYSVYPATAAVIAAFEDQLAPYARSKGTIRFPLDEPVPASLIAGIARVRAQEAADEVLEKKNAKAKGPARTGKSK